MSHYGDYQNLIYGAGLRGELPKLPANFEDLEKRAHAAMPPNLVSYIAGGCGNEHTQRLNVTAFERWGIIPRVLVDAKERDLSIDLFGLKFPSPVFMCPIGVAGISAQDGHGDLAVARASAQIQVPMMASTLSADPLERVAQELGDMPGFFQLYTPNVRPLAESFIQRAEAAGFKGIVVTLDTWIPGWRPRDLNLSNFPFLRGHCLTNFFSDPVFLAQLKQPPTKDLSAAIAYWLTVFGNNLTWEDLPWLRSTTKLPLILKGVCHPDDARRAIDAGMDGIFCSTHGGRQENGGLAALDMLPAVVAASGNTPVLFDSGVRSGTDVIKALALGATAVGVGRPFVYGLALDGTDGVAHVMRSILAEADLLMAVIGYPRRSDLIASALRRTGA